MNDAYIPVDGRETTQLQFMYSLYRTLKDDSSLQPRMQYIGLWWRYRGILKQLGNMFDAVWKTIEPSKRDRINLIWSQQELRIVNSSQAVDPTGDMMMIPRSAIVSMARLCQREKCDVCLGTNNDRKDCAFRRAMVDMAIPDLRKVEKQCGKCMGKLFDWGDD